MALMAMSVADIKLEINVNSNEIHDLIPESIESVIG
jgi:hypothetical protein